MNKSLAKNFEEGYEAFSKVQEFKSKHYGILYRQMPNPMRKNTTPYREWQRGWEAAYFKNLEKLNELGARS
mgnify:CR=1 FL=1